MAYIEPVRGLQELWIARGYPGLKPRDKTRLTNKRGFIQWDKVENGSTCYHAFCKIPT